MLLFGKRSVRERLKTNPKSILNLYLQEGTYHPEILQLSKKNHIPLKNLFPRKFFKLSRGALSQGIIAEVEKFKYQDLEKILDQKGSDQLTLICLDRITDPQNLGAIIRTCACLGKFCVVLPKHESVEINQTVLKVACGAENYVPICRVTNLTYAVRAAQKKMFSTLAAVTQGGEDLNNKKLEFPLCIIFGSEGKGIRQGIINIIDNKVTLPMPGANLSLNVAMSVGIFCYEVSAQRKKTSALVNQ